MDEIASISIRTVSIFHEAFTYFCLVFAVLVAVVSQLVQSVSKFALVVVRTAPVFNILFAELRFLFVGSVARGSTVEPRGLLS